MIVPFVEIQIWINKDPLPRQNLSQGSAKLAVAFMECHSKSNRSILSIMSDEIRSQLWILKDEETAHVQLKFHSMFRVYNDTIPEAPHEGVSCLAIVVSLPPPSSAPLPSTVTRSTCATCLPVNISHTQKPRVILVRKSLTEKHIRGS